MSHSTHSSAALVLSPASTPGLRVVLDAVVRTNRALLVQTARAHLPGRHHLAEDVVQDVCLAVLEGAVPLSSDPKVALLDMLGAVAAMARHQASGAKRRRKRP